MENKNTLHTWLEKLQQESWHLELLVSGFSIFLLVQAKQELLYLTDYVDLHYNFMHEVRNMVFLFIGISILGTYALIISLVFHIFMRGVWIGTIGLRSVQPEVDYKRLRLAPKMEELLQKKLPTLDRLLIRLDRISSSVFSFAFLAVFMLVSLAIWFVIFSLFILAINSGLELLAEDGLAFKVIKGISVVLILIFFISSVLYLIDTLSIGLIKRIKWFSKVYRWIYIALSTLTFSFVYRSIYYHQVSYIGVWKSRLLFNVFILSMVFFPYVRLPHAIFYPDRYPDNEMDNDYYDDVRKEDGEVWEAAIPSSLIEGNALPLFIRYSPSSNATLLQICDYKPTKEQKILTGFDFEGGGLNINDPYFNESSPDSLLQCLSSLYEVSIDDSLYQEQTFYFRQHHSADEPGIFTVLEIGDLPNGAHELSIDYKVWRESQDTIVVRNWCVIPFWKTE